MKVNSILFVHINFIEALLDKCHTLDDEFYICDFSMHKYNLNTLIMFNWGDESRAHHTFRCTHSWYR